MNNLYVGVVEARTGDPYKIGRCKVRVFGLHTEDKNELPTKDLPWAYPMAPINSASISGVGISTTGLLNGSWVIVAFIDEHKQKPIILGSLGGVPVSEHSSQIPFQNDAPPPLVDKEMKPAADNQSDPQEVPPGEAGDPKQMKISAAGKAFIKNHEALSSLEKGKNVPARNWSSVLENTPIYAYKDSVGKWTIGYGNRFLLNGTEVNENTVLTKAECDTLFETKLEQEFEQGVRSKLSSRVTQSMYDACISMAWNMGVSGFTSSSMFTALNSGKYNLAAALIPSTKTNGGKLTNRRLEEKQLFSSGGFPTADGSGVAPSPEQELNAAKEHSAATGVPIGSPSTTTSSDDSGFKDPDGVYPKYVNEQDSSRLTRRQSETETILKIKESARVVGVKSGGKSEWTQPKIPYVAAYPYNQIRVSESGHVIEIDDTKDAERLHWYHRAGTYTEIDANGTRVTRIVGDEYSILERSGYLYVKGNVHITVDGNANIRVESDVNLNVEGDIVANVKGNSFSAVKGNVTQKIGGSMALDIAGNYTVNVGKKTSIASENNVFSASNDSNLISTGITSVNGLKVNLNSGTGDTADTADAKLKDPSDDKEQAPLTTLSRHSELYGAMDTPEDGDPTRFNTQKQSIFDPDEKKETEPTNGVNVAQKAPQQNNIPCEQLTDADITPGYKLSALFTLGDLLNRGKSGYPKGLNYGKTASEIVCNLKNLAVNCLDPIKAAYPNMIITSTWRSQAYNATLAGASKTSDHLTGCAADIQFNGFNRDQCIQAAVAIQKLLPAYHQIILEYRGSTIWLHVSYRQTGNRMQCLTLDATKNKVLRSNGFC